MDPKLTKVTGKAGFVMHGGIGREVSRSTLTVAIFVMAFGSLRAFADDSAATAPYAPSAAASSTAPSPAAAAALGIAGGPQPGTGIVVGAWMLYPSFFAGGVYNDNVFETANSQVSALGLRLDPNLEADLNNGIYSTTIYLNGDAQLYPGQTSHDGETASTFLGRAGFAQLWQPTKDFDVRLTLDYSRQDSPFQSGLVTNSTIGSATSFVNSGLAPNVSSFRQDTDALTGKLVLEKRFTDQVFVNTGVGAQDLVYEAAPTGFSSPVGGMDYTAFVRAGFYLTPQIDAFVEADGDVHRYDVSSLDTNSYRVIGGLSTEMIGLFRGEAYAGYQQQYSSDGNFAAVSAPAYGASVYYYPTRYLTLAATVGESFGSAATQGVLAATPTPTSQVFQALFEVDYNLAQYWTAAARAGYADTTYSGSSRLDSAWTLGAGVSYTFWRNVSVTLDEQFIRTSTNAVAVPSYSQNLATLGLTYHY